MNTISKQDFTDYIKEFRHKDLFNELGWDNDRSRVSPLDVGNETVTPTIIADKNGFKIITVSLEQIPQYTVRSRIVGVLKKLFAKSLVIFTDKAKREQVWRYGNVDIKYHANQDVERLYQRASRLIFEIDEQDNITILDVTARVRTNFAANAERVTKKFYDAFRKEHKALLELISGITNTVDREWYASIMLNRLMFCYFMQRREFLNNDRDYLRNKLKESKQKLGNGKFYSFYRSFLMVLFQKGFGTYDHPSEVVDMIGEIPYLNGGLFDLHEVEAHNPNIDISDEAFERIFGLFDKYEWHLDTRDCATGNEISPDVLGYIFEKYINDRAAMGAYYTQEDITGYICRSSILPYLLDSVKKVYPKPFEKEGIIWEFLRQSGDTYIFDSVKKGTNLSLPDHIAIGVDTTVPNLIGRRKDWNTPAPNEYALPTEIWREVVDRHNRYFSVKSKIENGEITEVGDFITYNLDIVNFVNYLLETVDDPKFIKHFYQQLEKITVLDPTCGSGAFLFAAMTILEPLYDVCLSRMADYLDSPLERSTHHYFDEKLETMGSLHPNKPYFICKSIILNNLYGVDIMREAVETAKLRLFLKLVSTAEPQVYKDNYGIEPLPDIDFNVKCGNTLIGFANEQEIETALKGDLFCDKITGEAKDRMFGIAKATARYKQLQLGEGDYSAGGFNEAKTDLTNRQDELKATLDKVLKTFSYKSVSDIDWQKKHLPFHWVAEFYSIIVEKGGFDVVVGNPPYLELREVDYILHRYQTIDSDAIHAICIERAVSILHRKGTLSMIVPLALVSTKRMVSVQSIFETTNRNTWYANFAWRPGKLFDTVNRAMTIFVAMPSINPKTFSTGYRKWSSEARREVISTIAYSQVFRSRPAFWVPKFNVNYDESILNKLLSFVTQIRDYLSRSSTHKIYYRTTGGLYWKVFTDFAPLFKCNGQFGHSSRETTMSMTEANFLRPAIALLSSNLFWWWYTITSNLRDLNPSDIQEFPVNNNAMTEKRLSSLCVDYLDSIKQNSTMLLRNQRQTGKTETQSFKIQKSKPIIDQIDTILAEHYGFTEEELDYMTCCAFFGQ